MMRLDAIVVGGGPAGSSCARTLARAGLDTAVVDAAVFPRDKVCAGWITPPVVAALDLDLDDYRRGRTLQPISGFRTGVIGRASAVDVSYDHPISYGIRRCEFDDYLLARSGARVLTGEPVRDIRRAGGTWVVNEHIEAPVLVGAGGHFCPVARRLNESTAPGAIVAAQEAEFVVDDGKGGGYATPPERPELYFSRDFRGYGWCFRKQQVVNVGFGSLDRRALPRAVAAFTGFLRALGRVPAEAGWHWHGHAYRLYEPAPRRRVVDDGVLLVGDAAGVAYPESGEGIRPAIESGLMAAATIVSAAGSYARENLESYEARLRARFGAGRGGSPVTIPPAFVAALGRGLVRVPWFVRHVVLDRWFLHSEA